MRNETAVWWIRRDLRLGDNQALQAALAHGSQVIPLFILDPELQNSPYVGTKRLAFLLNGLRLLDAALRKKGSRLIVRQGDPLVELSAVLAETGATAIFCEEDFSPYARTRDARVRETLPLKLIAGLTVQPVGLIRKKDGDPYVVYTPFSKAWKSLPSPQAPDLLAAPTKINTPKEINSLAIPEVTPAQYQKFFPAGEREALDRLKRFTAGDGAPVFSYAKERNLPASEGTSQLSPYLRFGMVSARQMAVAAQQALDHALPGEARKGAETWLNELIWREFYINILAHFPRVREGNFNRKYDQIKWINDPDQLKAWQEGRTGYPLVDAAMRQLMHSGWMHNRARMITASFLVKDLLIDWRLGEKWFMQHLVDGDPAANNGGWQWTAGTGTDAAPYFRVFNPVTQSKKFDPQGAFIRRWLPELGSVSEKYIHEPWRMPQEMQVHANCRIGIDYPPPIVDHAWARERALAAYKSSST